VGLLHGVRLPGNRSSVPVSVVLLSLAGAIAYALASALQHRAAVRQPPETAIRPRLLIRLAQRPVWLLGNVADGAGYVCQFLALRRGSQALVQPLLLCGLIFALPIGSALEHRSITARDVAGAIIVVAGVAGFVAVSRPGPGNPQGSLAAWALVTPAVAAVVGAVTILARGPSRRRGVLLALGAGTVFGYTSTVAERTGRLLDHGLLHVVTSWTPYDLVLAAAVGMLLAQSAFQSGDLRFSLPVLTAAEPLVAIFLGQLLFSEHIASTGLDHPLEALCLVVMTAGTFVVARQPEEVPAPESG
jgi:drug/metabolite transporter (DMT)-like permease